MKVIQLKGLDTDLYPLIGPLVMNPKVLKANNNYPFKTTAKSSMVYCSKRSRRSNGLSACGKQKKHFCY